MHIEELQYPIGRFNCPEIITPELLTVAIATIEAFPSKIKSVVNTWSDAQLDTPYRPGGWTVRQLVHHCADSHMNSLVRYKWTLTEPSPTIKAYLQEQWAELADSKTLSIFPALEMISGIHQRWVYLLKSLTEDQYKRRFIHPETGQATPLDETTCRYAWHCNHHLAHIEKLKKRQGWGL